jgi:hypothetical protein
LTDTGWGGKCLTSQFLLLQTFSREPVPSLKQYICAKRQSNLQAGAVNVTAENSWRKRASSCFTLLLSFVVLDFWFTEGMWDVIVLFFRGVCVCVCVCVCVVCEGDCWRCGCAGSKAVHWFYLLWSKVPWISHVHVISQKLIFIVPQQT